MINPLNTSLNKYNNLVGQNKYLAVHQKYSHLAVTVKMGPAERFFRWLTSWTSLVDSTTTACARRSLKTFMHCYTRHPSLGIEKLKFVKKITNLKGEDFTKSLSQLTAVKSDLLAMKKIFIGLSTWRVSEGELKYPEQQQKLNDRGIPLSLSVPLPSPLDKETMQENLNRYFENSGGAKAVFKKAYDNLQHLTFSMLEEALKGCVQKLDQQLEQMNCPDYTVSIVEGKSNQWVAQLAMQYMKLLPTSLSFLESNENIQVSAPRHAFTNDFREEIVVMFDDNSCTGNQLINNIGALQALNRKMTVFVVIPFVAQKVYDRLKTFLGGEFDVRLITSDTRIQKSSDVFTENEISCLRRRIGGSSIDNQVWTVSDWRRFDGVSMPQCLTRPITVTGKGESDYYEYYIIPDVQRSYAYSCKPRSS